MGVGFSNFPSAPRNKKKGLYSLFAGNFGVSLIIYFAKFNKTFENKSTRGIRLMT